MFVIKEMRINKFERRPIISNRELFVAKGACEATIQSKQSSDCFDDPSLLGATKTKALGLASDIARTAWLKQNTDGKAPSLPGTPAKDL